MINIFPDELLLYLNNYLCNKDTINFLKTNSYIKNLFYKYGYLKSLVINSLYTDVYNFAIQTAKHSRTLNYISINNVNNPQHWIFYWPKKVYIYYCNITDKIDPPCICNTEYLEIINHKFINNNKKLIINWNKFPKLKYLKIRINNLELKDLNKNIFTDIQLYELQP